MQRGLILSKDAAVYLRFLRERNATAQVTNADSIPALLQQASSRIEQTTWLLAEPALAVEILDKLPQLRWMQSTWAGVEKLIAHPRRDYTLTNIRGVFAPLISEYVLAHLLAYERQLHAHHQAQRERIWYNNSHGATVGTLRGKIAVVLGVGSIGAGLVQVLSTLGVRVYGVAQQARAVAGCERVVTLKQISELLPQADYLINTLPNTPQTENLIDAGFLRQMKASAVLVNVGRGQAVVESDLAQALREGVIAHAVLDVYRTEPLPAEHIFWRTANLTLTSHTAAPSFPQDIFQVFWDNYQRFTAQQPLQHVVDFNKGY